MYQEILSSSFIPYIDDLTEPDEDGNSFLVQDGASPHSSKSTTQFLKCKKVNVIAWPGYSPDMNLIENLWGYMAGLVYPDGKAYPNIKTLERACRAAWKSISEEYIQNLFDSMDKRVKALVANKGGPTSY